MSTTRGENSMVRFAKGTKTLPRLTHVYRPGLNREATERVPVSRLGHALTQLLEKGLGDALDPAAVAQAKLELTELMDKISPSLKRNRAGLEMQPPVLLHCFPHWQVKPEKTVACLLPVHISQIKVMKKSAAGRVLLKIPPAPPPDSKTPSSRRGGAITTGTPKPQKVDPLTNILTDDGVHVSPRKFLSVCTKLVSSTLLKQLGEEETERMKLRTADGESVMSRGDTPRDLSLMLTLACGWTAELVPCVAVPPTADVPVSKGSLREVDYYVTRRFTSEVYEENDNAWRLCFAVKEHELLRSISSSDNGQRVCAMHVVCRLTSQDWRLAHITCYEVQTVLLHDMDFQVDYSPRWQRCKLETGLISLLKTLLYFVDRRGLPHFDLNQLNLWEGVTSRQMTQARGALNRFLSNENALISLVRRGSNDAGVVSVDFGLLGLRDF